MLSSHIRDIATWVCIAEHQSSFDTAAVGRQNGDGSSYYGLFQISDRYWCSTSDSSLEEGKACNVPCHKLIDEDLHDDVKCIRTIYDEHARISGNGFNAWVVYSTRCQNQNIEHISQCFDSKVLQKVNTVPSSSNVNGVASFSVVGKSGKVYEKCELAKELYHQHKLPMDQIATWVCIAKHESNFRTSAVGRLNTDGSADHGLFQISDLFWCSHDHYGGKACNIPCAKLLDSDITDDVRCIRMIHEEHTRLSGDGFNAWAVYRPHCLNQGLDRIKQCFSDKDFKESQSKSTPNGGSNRNALIPQSSGASKKGKIYNKCELAKELFHKHHMPMMQIPTWVCIAQHESSYNTAAVGRLNTDGSADHGLFQISDLYWCSHDHHGGKACNIPCDRLLDSDISDDIRCIKIIHEEHTRISGDGFNAWTVYKPHCRNQGLDRVKECFSDKELKESGTQIPSYSNSLIPQVHTSTTKGKIYNKCELAQELYHKHGLPIDQIPTWVCIAQHESSYNTAAVGRLNSDGSADHGLFQISDLYWCSHDRYGGKACNIPCERLLDSDIADDVQCIKIIHEEHTRISGDGFNAWTVYKPHCRNQGMDSIKQCFTEQELTYSASNTVSVITSNSIVPQTIRPSGTKKGKIYQKCELAKELYHKHSLPMEQIPTWVCIAQHESSYNTAAVGRLNTDGSADHGLFQISDLYWCSHDSYGGKTCNIHCDRLLDSDISDDIRCIKIIHEEHTRISGDGFNAWAVYKPHCRNQGLERIKECFSDKELKDISTKSGSSGHPNSLIPQSGTPTKKGKIYQKCELTKELYHTHHLPMDQIPTWVCIAQHESSYNTAAVGRLNTDGSADHGLFQISDLYWCSHDSYGGKACNIPCDRLLDSDISDDIRCIKMIHEEHTRISGDGFNAWAVYKPHCRNQGLERIKECFSDKELKDISTKSGSSGHSNSLIPQSGTPTKKGKIYQKCELTKELYHTHHLPMDQIPTWVCIAQHESSYNTAAVGRLNTDGSADHGLFQISDLYWCSHDSYGGKACNIPCDRLLDSDISDDIRCIKMIHEEHTRISGDGFNAWAVYKPHCRNQGLDRIKECFSEKELKEISANTGSSAHPNSLIPQSGTPTKKGKIYKKCELAQELYHTHHLPMDQIPTWVCIAQHESSFNTAAIGRLNADGSADHGLFQISDLYWCSHDQYGGKACNIACDKLIDSDISDDVRCIKIIHEEHTGISGDGFNAWAVYKPHCRNQSLDRIKECFSDKDLKDSSTKTGSSGPSNSLIPQTTKPSKKGKIYKKCELAQELYHTHHLPMDQIPTWVCIAQHESSFNTAAIGRLNADGSADHGLFQISDLYWCSHDQYGGKACNIACDKLIDSDISDDVRCIKIIHEEHTGISGDGFNAWAVYKPHCRNRQLSDIKSCFNSNEIDLYEKKTTADKYQPTKFNEPSKKPGDYGHNPFLQNIKIQNNAGQTPLKSPITNKVSTTTSSVNYNKNPFLNGSIKTSSISSTPASQSIQKQIVNNYANNPFLSGFTKNPSTSSQTTSKPITTTNKPHVQQNSGIYSKIQENSSADSQHSKYIDSSNFRPNTDSVNPSTPSKYVDTNNFRSTTTTTPRTTTTTRKTTARTTSVRPITTTPKPRTTTTVRTTTTTRKTTSTTTRSTTVRPFSTTIKPRTTPTAKTTATTRKPTTTTSSKPKTTTTAKPTTTRQPSFSTTKSTSTTKWNWNGGKYKPLQATTTTTKKPTTKSPTTTTIKTITTRPPSSHAKTNTLSHTTVNPTSTKSPKSTTSGWSWESFKLKETTTTQKSSTTTTSGTTSKKSLTTSKPSTTWSWNNRQTTKGKTPTTSWTTRKPSTTSWTTTKTSKPSSTPRANIITGNSNNGQYKGGKITSTTRKPSTTSKSPTTSWNWNSGQYKVSSSATTNKPTQSSTKSFKNTTIGIWQTTKKPITTTTTRKPQSLSTKTIYLWSSNSTAKPSATTTKTTTSRNWPTTKTPITTEHKTTSPTKPSNVWNSDSNSATKPWATTAKTTISRNWQTTKTPITTGHKTTSPTKPSNVWNSNPTAKSSTTKTTTSWNWQTTKVPITIGHKTTSPTKTSNLWNSNPTAKSSTTKLTTKTTSPKPQTTPSPKPQTTTTTAKRPLTNNNWKWQQPKYSNTTATTTLPTSLTSKPTNKPQQQTTWQHWQNGQQMKTTQKPLGTTKNAQISKTTSTTTTKHPITWGKGQGDKTISTTTKPHKNTQISNANLYKNNEDIFKHPFFDRVKKEQEQFRNTISSYIGSTVPPAFKNSSQYQEYKKNSSGKNIVSYNYAASSSVNGHVG
ncbi:uncharacterized protein LOC142234476 isoform X2 [Haematobia irritans]|uniref:uncharacterized protein LOC142234476 isoform X2 n=1 Tax=Haematobia irritans TaxID=7368 RepID=UPI003F4FA4EC